MANIHLKLSTDQTVSHIWCSEVPDPDFAQDLILNGAIATDPQTFALPLSQTSALTLRSLLRGKQVKLSPVDAAALSLIADRGRRGKTPNVFMTHDEKEVIVPARGAHLINEAHKINAYKIDSFFLIPAIKYRDFFNSLLTKDAEKLEHSPAIKDLFAGFGEKPEGMPEIVYNPFQVTGSFKGYDGSLASLREIPITAYDYVIKDLDKESKKKAGTKKKPRDIVKSLNAMGIKTAFDMLHHFPLRYVDRSSPRPIKSLVKGEEASVLAKVVGTPSYDFGKRMSKITIQDFYGTKLSLVFFNQPWLPRQFKDGDEVLVYGRYEPYVRKTDGMQFPSLSGPQINKIGDERSEVPIVPIYPQSEKSSITTWDILHLMKETFSKLDPEIMDPLDAEIREKYKLPSRYSAYKMLHFPENIKDVEESQRTLVYEELYRLQLFLLSQKKDFTLTPGISHKVISNGLVDLFLKKQPYSMTGAQERAKKEIFEDMSKPHPMHRLLQGDVGAGKAQPLDSLVLTPSGYAKMADIKVGSIVVTPDGSTSKVMGVYPQGKRGIYRITFSDNSVVESDGEHLWSVRTSTAAARGKDFKVKTLNELKDDLYEKNGALKWHVEVPKAVDLGDDSNLTVDPYLLGFLLGDGCLTSKGGALSFSTADSESLEEIGRLLPNSLSIKRAGDSYNYRISKKANKKLILKEEYSYLDIIKAYDDGYSLQEIAKAIGKSASYVNKILKANEVTLRKFAVTENPLVMQLKALDVFGHGSHTKFVPETYKNASIKARLALLQGLMDTDGTIVRDSSRSPSTSFCTVSDQLAEDVAWLVRSLGGISKVTRRKRKSGLSWHISIKMPNGLNPFRLPRKASLVQTKPKYHPQRRAIKTVELIGEKEAQCIYIDHPDHLYITDNFTITHNTTIANIAVLNSVESGHQAALMAPTEILAEQLYKGLAELAEDPEFISPRSGKPLNVVFLGTKLTAKNKKLTQEAIASGVVDIAVGTHALLSEHVSFPDLGMVVIDEQHRFGTAQRSHLRQARADGKTPDLLAMTATPIPRAAAMVLFGDLDITILNELPPGRIPIHTEWIEFPAQEAVESNSLRVWEHIRSEVSAGRQAYVVASLVEDNENLAAQSVDDAYHKLSDSVFPELRIGMVHGKLKKTDKEAVMKSFSKGDIDILVSTTVIEVGVNVPNSTVMVVLDPGRFGIAQLHQIRGRVGRSNLPSTCYLLGETNTPEGRDRLTALVESTDGFYLAEKDLEIRKEGTLFGSKQSGDSDLYIARLDKHSDILAKAREDANASIEKSSISFALQDEIRAFYEGKEIAS